MRRLCSSVSVQNYSIAVGSSHCRLLLVGENERHSRIRDCVGTLLASVKHSSAVIVFLAFRLQSTRASPSYNDVFDNYCVEKRRRQRGGSDAGKGLRFEVL
jgi:hypothetical protein